MPHVSLEPTEAGRVCHIPGNWRFTLFSAVMLVLGIEPASCVRATIDLNHKAIFPAQIHAFL